MPDRIEVMGVEVLTPEYRRIMEIVERLCRRGVLNLALMAAGERSAGHRLLAADRVSCASWRGSRG
ncbi:hypothetical protein [Streptomyces sp. NPDC048581]|uniref:hypothetical protein n=1 Tax=unclassified Streptomyces TaxID=2593676 RepID=UPI003719E00F